MTSRIPTTRLAPSPTGALHLGNARTFLVNWAIARQRGWRIILRIEDLDTPRVKDNADIQAIEMLKWLGMDWDEGPFYQLDDLSPYRNALKYLADEAQIYQCPATRSEIRDAQSAPHGDQHELRYPGLYRPPAGTVQPFAFSEDDSFAWRVRVEDEPIAFEDEYAGEQSHNIDQITGDFIVASKAGLPSYQLAVVVDDHRQGVTHVVRGADLLSSAARQLWLYRLLNYDPKPNYVHLPLIIGQDGRRLAKRHGDTRLVHYRDSGIRPERIIGLIGKWCGFGEREELTAEAFKNQLELAKIPNHETTFTEDDEQWLTG